MQDLYLIDSMALAFRAFYAFPTNPLVNSKGEETTVVFGYGNFIFRLLADKNAHHLAIATDLAGPTFRHQMYDQYKANRAAMPENLRAQLPMLAELIQILNIPVLSQEGFEADDLIASAATQYTDAQIYICSKDKDLMQLINDQVKMLYHDKKEEVIVGREQVIEKWGVPPEQVHDLLALMGDASDNIPGVPKIGPKTAAGLLAEYGSLDGIYAALDQITKKAVKENLSNFKAEAYLSYKLVELTKDLSLPPMDSLVYSGFDLAKMEAFLEKHELKSMLRLARNAHKALGGNSSTPSISTPSKPTWGTPEYQLIQDTQSLLAFLAQNENENLWALDTETTGLNPRESQIAGICLSANGVQGVYIPLCHQNSLNLDIKSAQEILNPLFTNPQKSFVCHHAKFDLAMLMENNWALPLNIHDSMIASYLLNPGVREHSLDEQVHKRLEHEMIPIESLIGKGKSQITFDQLSATDAYTYSAEDAVFTYRLWKTLESELKQENLWDVYTTQEIPTMLCLLKMEARGICVDPSVLQELATEVGERLKKLEELIYQQAGQSFTISSPKQLGEILFDVLKLPHGKKTKTGWSTDASVLESLENSHPIIASILEFREIEKLRNTYIEALPKQIEKLSQRIHTNYSQTIAATGRLSSNNPNLQNIPIRSPLGARIRSAFVAPSPEWKILSADYSQIELRILAELSQDSHLIQAYVDGIDIHTQTASLLFRTFPEMVTSEMRRAAKAINFGVLYGMSAFRLSNELGIPRKTAQDFIDGYFAAYPSVTQFIKDTVEKSRQDGFVKTMSGLRRLLPDLNHENANIRAGAERTAVNTPVQGSAADLIKKAMIQLESQIPSSGLRLRLLLQVHDELVFEVHEDDLSEAQELIRQSMENVVTLKVPLKVEIGVGNNWKDAH